MGAIKDMTIEIQEMIDDGYSNKQILTELQVESKYHSNVISLINCLKES